MNKFKRFLPRTFSEVTSFLVLVSAIVVFLVLLEYLTSPPPYEYKNLKHEEYITVCPGEKFSYDVDVVVNQSPITIFRTETYLPEAGESDDTWDYDTWSNVEIYNWDDRVKGVLHRHNEVTFPEVFATGKAPKPGLYRYVVSKNTYGEKRPATISIPIEVPDFCPQYSHK